VPTFSIIIPAYNSESTLLRAVKSVLAQNHPDFEVVVVNDGSSDSTATVIEELVLDNRVKAIAQDNAGVSAARNAGANIAQGEWLVFLDSDDEMRESALSILSLFASNSDVSVIRGGFIKRNDKGGILRIPDGKKFVPPLAGSFGVRKASFIEVGGYDEQLKFSENTELFHRYSLAKLPEVYVKEYLFFYNHSNDGGSKNRRNLIESTELILEKHQRTLSSHIKYLYHQILGVNYMRFKKYREARKHLLRAWTFRPYKLGVLLRLLIAMLPPIARRLYGVPASAR
jgi:glycosyltransferase involved in cell wall biosynthesis